MRKEMNLSELLKSNESIYWVPIAKLPNLVEKVGVINCFVESPSQPLMYDMSDDVRNEPNYFDQINMAAYQDARLAMGASPTGTKAKVIQEFTGVQE